MTDTLYFETYEKLLYVIESRRELDETLFLRIFDGKIKPIIYSSFAKLAAHFNSEDVEDVCQDIFLLLWKKSVIGYFLNAKYEKSPLWFLSWCKVVVNNYLITKVRKKSNRPAEELDNPERPLFISDASEEPGHRMVNREAVKLVYSGVIRMNTKPAMKLTWLGVYTFIYLGYVANRIEAIHKFLERFYCKSLNDIYAFTESALGGTEWLALSASEKSVISEELERRSGDGALGESLLSTFIEEENALAKVSDWLYKINKRLIEALPREVSEWNT